MERVTGIGGVFFKASDPRALLDWYARHLGVPAASDFSGGIFTRAAGVAVDDRVEESEFGRFGWAMDPEGNRFELWEPPMESPAPAGPETDGST